MTRGLGRGGRPLGNTHEDHQPESVQPSYTQAERDKHNAAVQRIQYYRSPAYPGFGTPAADAMVRQASNDLIPGMPF